MKKTIFSVIALVLCFVLCSPSNSYLINAGGGEEDETGLQETDAGTNEDAIETVNTNTLVIEAKSAVLIEGSTGKILFEKEKDLQMEPASITKIMTLLLIFEALDEGKIKLTDTVSVSEHAASMGGSQVYLEPYETQNVDTMIKCISIASANDASVAMAEFLAGSETEFVARMNARAKELGMMNTNFENCCGLDDTTVNHVSTAYDVALMSRELITKHPEVQKYTTTWMDSFVHVTKKGESEFGLTNTNKLVRTYNGITGLKTGSTSKAKYCVSATAKRGDMDLIAVIMCAPQPVVRFQDAAKLLDYGFATVKLYKDDNKDLVIEPVHVKGGVVDTVDGSVNDIFSYVCFDGQSPEDISKEILLYEEVPAPIAVGDAIGEITYKLDGEVIGKIPICAKEDIREMNYADALFKMFDKFFID